MQSYYVLQKAVVRIQQRVQELYLACPFAELLADVALKKLHSLNE